MWKCSVIFLCHVVSVHRHSWYLVDQKHVIVNGICYTTNFCGGYENEYLSVETVWGIQQDPEILV